MLELLMIFYILLPLLIILLEKIWVFALKSKDQLLDMFKHFHAGAENKMRQLKYI